MAEELSLKQVNKILAPHIIGNSIAKQLLFLQLFTKPSRGEYFNILMIGDTASSKTDLVDEVRSFFSNNVFVGKSTTSVGLIGAVNNGQLIGGVLNKINNGVVYIDELDKLESDVKKMLLQTMDKYGVTITKGGFQFLINPRANYTATANPKGGNWIGQTPQESQIPFSSTLLNRFHIVIPFKSLSTEEYPKLKDSFVTREDENAKKDRLETLKQYVIDSRRYEKINVPKHLIGNAVDFIQTCREEYSQYLPLISPRQIDGFIAMMKASARMNLRHEVTEGDYKQIKEFFNNMFKLWIPGEETE